MKIPSQVFTLVTSLAFALPLMVWAANTHLLNSGASSQLVDEHGVCRYVSNAAAVNYTIPTKFDYEWTAFRNFPPTGVSMTNCCTSGSITVASSGSITIPTYCRNVVVHSWGGGGGGGISAKGGDGGAGGYAYTGTLTIPSGNVYSITIGQGGSSGNCTTPSGGAGAYPGGAGGINSVGAPGTDGTPAATGGTGGAAGSFKGGDGKYGGGGGAGASDATNYGAGGGGATRVVDTTASSTTILIAGGGGGGGGAGGGAGNGGNGGPGCAQVGVAGGASKGGGGGGGDCYSVSSLEGNGTARTPSNSTLAGTKAAGGQANKPCLGTGDGTAGVVIFQYSAP